MGHVQSFVDGETMARRVARLELLLREANHRIANSLQLASAVVGRDARAVGDAAVRARLYTTRQHIEAIAGIHTLLSCGDTAGTLPLLPYLVRLIDGLRQSASDGSGARAISLRCDRSRVPPELAACFGMIVNELVGNAYKYAYAPDQPGEVRVGFAMSGDSFVLKVEDDGRGFDLRKRPEGTGLGMSMIGTMARQIGADFRYEDVPFGSRAVLRGTVQSPRYRPATVPAESRR